MVANHQPIHQAPLEHDPRGNFWLSFPGSVLLDNEIEYFSTEVTPKLIEPFDPKNLKPARYQLTLGPEAQVGGKTKHIDDNNPLVIPPHQVAIVRTWESLNIPRFLIGRWNLKVDMAYKGLLWVGALQVDPGWTGYLPCPLYNLSDQEVRITFKEKVFTIDFVRTTLFDPKVNRSYPAPSDRAVPHYNPPIAAFDPLHLRSGPYEVQRELREVLDLKNWLLPAFGVLFAVVAAITAALGIVALRPVVDVGPNATLLSGWPMTAVALAVFSAVLSIFSCLVALQFRTKLRR